MDDFSQMLELVAQQLKVSDSTLRVERAYPAKLRGNPQCEKLAVIGIQKVKLEPVGLQNFYGGQTLPLGRQATVWVKVSFCCKSGEDCWKMLILIPGYSRRNTGRMWGSHSALAA